MKTEEEVILPTDARAAKFGTVEGWFSRHGRFYGNGPEAERVARYDGSTHSVCTTCGTPCPKHYITCGACRRKRDQQAYLQCKKKPWDGCSIIYSECTDTYHQDHDDIYQLLTELLGYTLEDLMLYHCKPQYARQIDYDFNCDELPEDGENPLEVVAAMKAYNEAVKGIILSWVPDKKLGVKIDDSLRKVYEEAKAEWGDQEDD